MAERKLTPREKQLKREDPERFALLMANRTKRKGSMKTGLTKFSKDKTFKPTKKKKKVKRNQRIGGGTLFSKLSKDSVTDSAEKREDKVRPKRAKPVVAIKPSVSKKRGSMTPGLNKAKKSAKEREAKVNRNLTLGKKVIPTPIPIPKAMTMKKKPAPSKKRSPIAKSDTRYLNDYRIEKTAADDNYDPRKTVDGAMLGGYGTPKDFPDKIVTNPFTGKPMTIEYSYPSSDDPDNNMKKGGSIKKKMKKTKVKKRAALRGQGKALRGF